MAAQLLTCQSITTEIVWSILTTLSLKQLLLSDRRDRWHFAFHLGKDKLFNKDLKLELFYLWLKLMIITNADPSALSCISAANIFNLFWKVCAVPVHLFTHKYIHHTQLYNFLVTLDSTNENFQHKQLQRDQKCVRINYNRSKCCTLPKTDDTILYWPSQCCKKASWLINIFIWFIKNKKYWTLSNY